MRTICSLAFGLSAQHSVSPANVQLIPASGVRERPCLPSTQTVGNQGEADLSLCREAHRFCAVCSEWAGRASRLGLMSPFHVPDASGGPAEAGRQVCEVPVMRVHSWDSEAKKLAVASPNES